MEAIHVVGAGGIGCAVGYALIAAGARVVFVDTDPAKIEWGNVHGVHVDRRGTLATQFVAFADWQPADGATIFLCTKCYDNAAVLERLRGPVTLIPIQNGFDPDLQARAHELEGIASFVSECRPHQPSTRITRQGRFHFGYRRPVSNMRPHRLFELLRGTNLFRATWVPNILPFKYTKLLYNAAISPLAAAAGLDNGQLLSIPKARRLFFEQLRENYTILRAAGVPLGKIGPFHPVTVSRILQRLSMANILAWAFYPTLKGTYCSMSGDLPAGCTEIEYYNRHLIDLAGEQPCPRNRRVYELVKRMERERLTPGLHMLDELL